LQCEKKQQQIGAIAKEPNQTLESPLAEQQQQQRGGFFAW